jgi:hypothetical protein
VYQSAFKKNVTPEKLDWQNQKLFKTCGKLIFLFFIATLLVFANRSVCLAAEPLSESGTQPPAWADFSNKGSIGGSDDTGWLETIKGRKARDALLLGMWSLHLNGSGRSTGHGNNNEVNQLLGVQYYGLTAGTFVNSQDRRSFFGGVAREVWSNECTPDVRFDIGYKAGLMTGYQEKFPDLQGVVPFLAAFFGVSFKRMGVDVGVTPLGVFTLNFRIDIDHLFETP